MHKTLQVAFDRANALMVELTSGDDSPAAELKRLKTLTKAQLIAELMELKTKKMKSFKVEDMAYAIMCDKDCGPLSYAMIASVIVKYRPGKTNEDNIRWYNSQAIEKGKDTVPRLAQKELNKLIMASLEM